MAEFRTDGFRELEANLRILREQFGVKTGGVVIRGLRAGAKLIRNEARRRVIKVPSSFASLSDRRAGGKASKRMRSLEALLRSNIIEHPIPISSRLAGGRPTVLIRVRNRGYDRVNGRIRFKRPGSAPGWWWWLEFGTSKTAARPFMRPAVEAMRHAALEAQKATMRAEIDKLFSKFTRMAA